jgi:hypothetical protein
MLQHSISSIKREKERESVCGGGVKAALNFNSELD